MNLRDAFEFAGFVVTVVALPLRGEAPAFQTCIQRVADEERGGATLPTPA